MKKILKVCFFKVKVKQRQMYLCKYLTASSLLNSGKQDKAVGR